MYGIIRLIMTPGQLLLDIALDVDQVFVSHNGAYDTKTVFSRHRRMRTALAFCAFL